MSRGELLYFQGKELWRFHFCLCHFHIPFLWSHLLNERICSHRSKFFLLNDDPILKGLWRPANENKKSKMLFPLAKYAHKMEVYPYTFRTNAKRFPNKHKALNRRCTDVNANVMTTASTLIRHHFYAMCPLGDLFS